MTETHNFPKKSGLGEAIEKDCWVVTRICPCGQRPNDFVVRCTDMLHLTPERELFSRWCFESEAKLQTNLSEYSLLEELHGGESLPLQASV